MAERIEREQNLSFREAQRRERIRRNKEKRQFWAESVSSQGQL